MEDGATFTDPILALNCLNLLRQGFVGNIPATWMLNQNFTTAELTELEQRVAERPRMTKLDRVIRAMKEGDEEKVLDAIRMARSMDTLTSYLDKIEECPMKSALEDVCIDLRRPCVSDEQLIAYTNDQPVVTLSVVTEDADDLFV